MKNIVFFILFLSSGLFMSCRSVIYAVFLRGRAVEGKATLMVNHTEEREVILIPMMHTGRPAYYQKVKNYLDTLRHRGYVVYYEGLGTVDPRMLPDSLRPKYDTIQRKFRRVTGMHLTGYDRKDNPSLPFKTKGKTGHRNTGVKRHYKRGYPCRSVYRRTDKNMKQQFIFIYYFFPYFLIPVIRFSGY